MQTRPGAGITRWGGLAGVAYVVLFAVGVILLRQLAGHERRAGEDRLLVFRQRQPGQDRLGWLAAGLGILCFVWFLSALRQAVRGLEGEDGFLTGLVTIGGGIYGTLAGLLPLVRRGAVGARRRHLMAVRAGRVPETAPLPA